MTGAMKTMLRELLGYQGIFIREVPRPFSQIVTQADRRAADELAKIGVVTIRETEHGVRAYRLRPSDADVTLGAAAIVDFWLGRTDWRDRLNESEFLESGDWQRAVEEARAVLGATANAKVSA